jgi:uncharacterized membrane protein
MIDMMDPGLGLLVMLVCGLGGLVLLVAVVLVAGRLLSPRGDGLDRARSVLHGRLASGEIDIEEYYERDSALRQAAPAPRGRRRGAL